MSDRKEPQQPAWPVAFQVAEEQHGRQPQKRRGLPRKDPRAYQINMRISEEERDRFLRVAEALGLDVTGAIRLLMRKADDRPAKK